MSQLLALYYYAGCPLLSLAVTRHQIRLWWRAIIVRLAITRTHSMTGHHG
ncbi:hypothetical protein YpMG051020_3360 [Yersinia pestis biovar Orientalis str. MG05-1020]|nr:hypothetical protein YpMG051020_3360 [Yersinia pestis biovar Orientalis str. MG05-1020]